MCVYPIYSKFIHCICVQLGALFTLFCPQPRICIQCHKKLKCNKCSVLLLFIKVNAVNGPNENVSPHIWNESPTLLSLSHRLACVLVRLLVTCSLSFSGAGSRSGLSLKFFYYWHFLKTYYNYTYLTINCWYFIKYVL